VLPLPCHHHTGAGTGKTTTLIARVMHLVHNCGVHPGDVLAITFTKKAAQEMAARLAARGVPPGLLACSTFHSFCLKVLFRWYRVGGSQPAAGAS
jgi:DNA helicase-2/ATP-dependent DNA helicase PcrA